ncbi:hypothetical protein with DUF577 [Prunus dulcis]|uniref:Uncharacterized protein n=1 Tax=Prunus dulcis TaxID=3755 RepID=A0A4Y1RFU9_PRUDU|nr:hypothetical protein with DUF577 [Prunus dulcis]
MVVKLCDRTKKLPPKKSSSSVNSRASGMLSSVLSSSGLPVLGSGEPREKPAVVESKPGHINLFEGIKIFDPIKGLENEGDDGKDGFKKNKKMKKEEKPRVVTAEDEKYRLGYGVAVKELSCHDANDDSGDGDESSKGAKGEMKNKSGKKTLEELREERLEREKREKERERALILNKTRKGGAALKDRRFSRRLK